LINRLKPRGMPWVYLGLLLVLSFFGCTSREDPSEVLLVCGNHTCGDLTMVTSDTSSDGWQYLEPALSPDGTRLVFTADWGALLREGEHLPDPIPVIRNLVIMPMREGTYPDVNLASQGANTVRFQIRLFDQSGSNVVRNFNEFQKGSPLWYDDNSLICWIETPKGNRIFRVAPLGGEEVPVELLYREPEDALPTGRFWQHLDPSLSPDRQWIVFSRFGFANIDSLHTYTKQQLWVLSMASAGEGRTNQVFPITREVAQIGDPAWSPDGRRICFYASMDMVNEPGVSGTELYSVAFDTLGLAENGGVALDRDLKRLTFTRLDAGNPLNGVDNFSPKYTNDGQSIVFVSNRRAPSITLHDRSIWRIPVDGRLDPEILFFSREDDVDPFIPEGTDGVLILSSAMGFPTQMLDRLYQESLIRLAEENPDLSEPEIAILAAQERRELEFFARVMSHIFVFSGW
jgi:dipeptidyl aminopeptidase/acylaminoacyl peptidase